MDNECLSPDDAGWTRLCCSKLPCPSGDFCEDDNGNGGNCP